MTDPTQPPGPDSPQEPGSYPPPGYGQPPAYGQPPMGAYGPPPGAAGWGGPPLAGWGDRFVAGLLDYVVPGLAAGALGLFNDSLGLVANLLALAYIIYIKYQEGQTGQTPGKKVAGTRLLREQDGQLVGGGLAIGRYFLHILDALPCYVGFLWPLWDAKKQTFADKILKTVVIKA